MTKYEHLQEQSDLRLVKSRAALRCAEQVMIFGDKIIAQSRAVLRQSKRVENGPRRDVVGARQFD